MSGAPPAIGASSQFVATATFKDGTTQNVSAQSNWQSSLTTVAMVSPSGVVTATGPGEANIEASYQNVTGALHITVTALRTFTLLGVVTQAGSSSPVQGVSVSVIGGVNAGRLTSTDGNGFYNLGGLQSGSLTLEAVKAGYAAADNIVDLTSDRRFDFSMKVNGAPAPVTLQCNASLWSHVYDASRLRLIDSCRAVTGTISDQHTNDDGDVDVRLALDPPYKSLLNAGNVSNLSGHLQTEAICQAPIHAADAARACQAFSGSVRVPPNGTHVQVTGSYVLDTNHGWMEIHPISDLRIIP